MKKFIIILFLWLNIIIIAHEQHVHQYLTREAYLLLKSVYGDIPIMVDHVGTTQQGSGPWTSPYIVAGAYREDEEDVVYHEEGFFGIYTSGTHFWIADDGENSNVTLKWVFNQVYGQKTFPSAYTKIRAYAYGNWEVQGSSDWLFKWDGKNARLLDQTGRSCRKFYYGSLVDLYINGQVQIRDLSYEYYVLEVNGGDNHLLVPDNNNIIYLTLNDDTKNKVVWEVLGRMCHLLQDMSVPTHAHGDAHGICDPGINHDTYEKWVGSSVSPYNSPYLAISHNGMSSFLNPIGKDKPLYYLMYRVQQVADHFGSNGPYNGDGNDFLPVTSPSYYNIPLYILPTSPTSINDFACCTDLAGEPCYNRDGTSLQNRINIRDATLPLAISGTAGILYWFAVETGLLTNITVQNNFTGGTVKVNNVDKNSPYTYSNIVGLPLSFEAVTPQNDGEGYQRIWNNFAPNAVSLWRVLKGSSSYDILPPNIQHSFVTTLADNKSTYIAGLRKNYKIDVIHQTEFDGNRTKPPIWIVEQNNGLISAPLDTTINGRAYKFAGWTDGNGDNLRTIWPDNNQTYTALYKMVHKSNDETAYANNSRRKFLRNSNGMLFNCYQSMNKVWLESSTDNGITWKLENKDKPIQVTGNNASCPSIAVDGRGNLNLTFQENNPSNGTSIICVVSYNIGLKQTRTLLSKTFENPNQAELKPITKLNGNRSVVTMWLSSIGQLVFCFGMYADGSDHIVVSWEETGNAYDLENNVSNFTIERQDGYSNRFHLVWQKNTTEGKSELYYNVLVVNGNTLYDLEYHYDSTKNISSRSGFTKNYNPSIIELNSGARVCWIGERGEEYPHSTEGSQKTVVFVDPANTSRYWTFGSNVNSVSINKCNTKYVIAWARTDNDSIQYTDSESLRPPFYSLGIKGKYVQVSNGTEPTTMHALAFNTASQPYYMQTRQLYRNPKAIYAEESREGVVSEAEAQVYYSLGEVKIDEEPISFVEIPDTASITNQQSANQYLVSEPFTLTDNSEFFYSVQYGLTDSLSALAMLTDNKQISFKVELLDAVTNEAIGVFDEVTYNQANIEPYEKIDYQVLTNGIGERLVKMRLVISSNFNPFYSVAEKYAEPTGLAKKSYKQISYQGSLAVKEYALEQNYPNPFNPSTVISWQSPVSSHQSLKVYDVLGREVATLVNEWREAGRYSVEFNGSSLASGVYIYQLRVNDPSISSGHGYVATKKLMLIK